MRKEVLTAPAPSGSSRLTWLDANRVFAAVGVVLIHSTADSSGGPYTAYPPAQRAVPAMLRGVAEFSGAEIFIVFSMFLLAFKLSKQDHRYGAVIWDQAKKLFVPYLAWSLVFAFFRLAKAHAFGYEGVILRELTSWKAWAGYVLLGSAQYHLHFIPTLFGVLLMYPLFRSAIRFPAMGAALLAGVFVLGSGEGWLWGHVHDPLLRDYLVRILKTCAYKQPRPRAAPVIPTAATPGAEPRG
jgi:surface polysaccharide O-acyltransferase-like enzyme